MKARHGNRARHRGVTRGREVLDEPFRCRRRSRWLRLEPRRPHRYRGQAALDARCRSFSSGGLRTGSDWHPRGICRVHVWSIQCVVARPYTDVRTLSPLQSVLAGTSEEGRRSPVCLPGCRVPLPLRSRSACRPPMRTSRPPRPAIRSSPPCRAASGAGVSARLTDRAHRRGTPRGHLALEAALGALPPSTRGMWLRGAPTPGVFSSSSSRRLAVSMYCAT